MSSVKLSRASSTKSLALFTDNINAASDISAADSLYQLGTALFLLCATAITHADLDNTEIDGFLDNGCPKDPTIEKFLPHEDCEQFYQCFHGALISRFCPNGLHFNADLEKCDWLGNADCHTKPDEDEDSTSEELDKNNPNHATLICSSPDSNDVLIVHKNCNQFFKCSYGRALVLNCAENLLYNAISEKCDSPENVNCSNRLRPLNENKIMVPAAKMAIASSYSIEEIDQSNSDSSQAIAQCSAKRSDGVLVAHEYCNKFYRCFGGLPITVKCPYTLFYDPIKEYCDLPANVDCDGRTIADEIDDGIKAASVEKIKEAQNNVISSDDEHDSADAICAADESDGVLVEHDMCDHFYKCSERQPVVYNCPGGLLFNSKEKYCDWPHNTDCGERTEPEVPANETKKETEDPNQALTICAKEGSDGVLVAHEKCDLFYECHDGRPVVVACPDILLYNLKKEYCDWPTHVNCEDRTVPENGWSLREDDENNAHSGHDKRHKKKNRKHHNNDINNAAEICADESSDGKLLPHQNCNQFFKCFGGKEVALFCPLNLFYHIHKEKCDWSYNVVCGNRQAPSNDSIATDSPYQAEVNGTTRSIT